MLMLSVDFIVRHVWDMLMIERLFHRVPCLGHADDERWYYRVSCLGQADHERWFHRVSCLGHTNN